MRKIKTNELKKYPYIEEFMLGNLEEIYQYKDIKEYKDQQKNTDRLRELKDIENEIQGLKNDNLILLIEIGGKLMLELNKLDNESEVKND